MLIRKVKEVIVHRVKSYSVGGKVNNREIFEIQDHSREFENGEIDSFYLCVDKDSNLLASIENCPVIVEYEYFEIDKPEKLAKEVAEKATQNE